MSRATDLGEDDASEPECAHLALAATSFICVVTLPLVGKVLVAEVTNQQPTYINGLQSRGK